MALPTHRTAPVPEAERAQVRDLALAGMSKAELARRFSRAEGTINRILDRAGIIPKRGTSRNIEEGSYGSHAGLRLVGNAPTTSAPLTPQAKLAAVQAAWKRYRDAHTFLVANGVNPASGQFTFTIDLMRAA